MNVVDLGNGDINTPGSAGEAIRTAQKYVNLDLSSSAITSLGRETFTGLSNLVGITIPTTVTSIPNFAFQSCSNLTSVTFQGTIPEANFSSMWPFDGDLRAKYLATGGGKGTYTTTAPVSSSSVWTKQ